MATITIASQITELEWGSQTPPRLRIYAKVPFITGGGVPVLAGSPNGGRAYWDDACTLEAVTNRVITPAVTLPSTTDSVDKPGEAEYTAYLYSRGADSSAQYQEYSVFAAGFRLDESDTPTTWEAIKSFNMDAPAVVTPRNYTVNDLTVQDDLTVADVSTFDGPATFNDSATFAGTVLGAVKSFNSREGPVTLLSADLNGLDGSGLTGIGTGTGGVVNTGSTTIGADSDADGTGVVAIQTRGVTRLEITNDGATKVNGPLMLPKYATADLPALTSADAGTVLEVTDGARGVHRWNGSDWVKMGAADPRDWLCKFDGSTNDTAELQDAIDDCETEGAMLKLPAGVSMIDNVTWRPAVPVWGHGYDKPTPVTGVPTETGTILRSASAVAMWNLPEDTIHYCPGDLRGFTLDGNDLGTIGFNMVGVQAFLLERVSAIRFAGTGLKLAGSLMGRVRDCIFNYNLTGVHALTQSVGAIPNMPPTFLLFDNVRIQANDNWGMNLQGVGQATLFKCNFEFNGTAADATTGALWVRDHGGLGEGLGAQLLDCWFERNEGLANIRIGAPAAQHVRTEIARTTCPLNASNTTHDLYVESGGSAAQYQTVNVRGSVLRGSTNGITLSGVNISLVAEGSHIKSLTIPSGAAYEIRNCVGFRNTTGSQAYARSEVSGGQNSIEAIPSDSNTAVDQYINLNCYYDGALWQRPLTSKPAWSVQFSSVSNAIIFRRWTSATGTGVANPWTTIFQVDAGAGATDSGLQLLINSLLKRVSMGAADSGGAGFRLLRVPN